MCRLWPISVVCAFLILTSCTDNANNSARQFHADEASKYKIAIELSNKQDFDGAIKELDGIIEKSPSDAYAYRLRGNFFNRKGDADRAMIDFNKSIEFGPKDEITLCVRGDTYLAKGDTEKAMADYADLCRKSRIAFWRMTLAFFVRGPGLKRLQTLKAE